MQKLEQSTRARKQNGMEKNDESRPSEWAKAAATEVKKKIQSHVFRNTAGISGRWSSFCLASIGGCKSIDAHDDEDDEWRRRCVDWIEQRIHNGHYIRLLRLENTLTAAQTMRLVLGVRVECGCGRSSKAHTEPNRRIQWTKSLERPFLSTSFVCIHSVRNNVRAVVRHAPMNGHEWNTNISSALPFWPFG